MERTAHHSGFAIQTLGDGVAPVELLGGARNFGHLWSAARGPDVPWPRASAASHGEQPRGCQLQLHKLNHGARSVDAAILAIGRPLQVLASL